MGFVDDVFGHGKAVVGVVHLLPLPGSPRWGGDMGEVLARAEADACALEESGFDGIIVENFGDAPFARGFAGRGAVAGLAAAGDRVAQAAGVPLGVNVLRNDALSAVAVAAAVGARFIRVNVHVGAVVADQGVLEGDAMATMRAVREMAPGLRVVADVGVKHATPLAATSLEAQARDAVQRGLASALIVTGQATGSPARPEDLERVKTAVPETDVLVGSGVTPETAAATLAASEGVIVGSAVMRDGKPGGPVDAGRARDFIRAARAAG
ncbi:MAG: BtpA/SgcQ family protein [Candidatus Eisenbacteria bacterium]|nr:BtpA/SgcQ family protein [Candidatus Eisenbacteria bacterium]